MKWLIYALGGGLGHLTRSLALARTAGRQGIECTILSNSPGIRWVPASRELQPTGRLIEIASDADRDAVAREVQSVLSSVDFDVLVVDTFPRGLGGELVKLLPDIRTPKVLVHRDLNPRYVEQYDLGDFVRSYDCLLMPGETGPLHQHPNAIMTSHWLIRDADELLSREAARKELLERDADGHPVVIVSGSGRAEEVRKMHGLADEFCEQFRGEAHVCFVGPGAGRAPVWPLLSLMNGVDIVVGAGGYNTVSETRATKTPLLAVAQPRLYDRQDMRLKSTERVETYGEFRPRLSGLLVRHRFTGTAGFVNGTHLAVDTVQRLISGPVK